MIKKVTFPGHLLLLALLAVSGACVQKPENNKRSSSESFGSSDSTGTGTTGDELGSPSLGNNYFQNGEIQSNSTLGLEANFGDNFLIRGDEVSNYLKNNSTTDDQLCLLSYYPNTATGANKVVLMAAVKESFLNFQTQEQEFFLRLQPNNKTLNESRCITTNLINTTINNVDVTSAQITATIKDLCPSCAQAVLSQPLSLYTNGGSAIGQIKLNNLRLQITPSGSSPPTSGGSLSCQDSSSCLALGYQCCLEGQCVLDGQLRSEVDTNSSSFQEAQQDILANPDHFTKYPQYFYVCPIQPNIPPPSEEPIDSVQLEKERLERLKELKNCITTDEDEMAICTIAFENADLLIANGNTRFHTLAADLNFQNVMQEMPNSSIASVSYGGVPLATDLDGNGSADILPSYNSVISIDGSNDNFSDRSYVDIINPQGLPSNLPNTTLKIRYKVDATCKKLTSSVLGDRLAKCKKTYYQGKGQNGDLTPRPSHHYDTALGLGGNATSTATHFDLPFYYDPDYNIIVKRDGNTVLTNEYQICNPGQCGGSANADRYFIGFNSEINETQKVEIEFFTSDDVLDSASISDITQAVDHAQQSINQACGCGDLACTLEEVYNDQGNIIDYSCVYPESPNDLPLQKRVIVSSQNAPHRFFDINGTYYQYTSELGLRTQSGTKPLAQEGNKFTYENSGDLILPNNLKGYVGFNEIYGSFKPTDKRGSHPAVEIEVKKGRFYDLVAVQGSYSPLAGLTDYYPSFRPYFAGNSNQAAGGYHPDPVETRRDDIFPSDHYPSKTEFRADDFLFGRACFLPATMIPWSHVISPGNVAEQRRARLAAQHFLFANGYHRDWFGFDYGSLIGSYDGVTWFSVGRTRRTKAKTNKLFLAVNGFYSDQTQGAYTVDIAEVSSPVNAENAITNDLDSSGAQCQQYHVCDTDRDCFTRLGYDYMCESVTNLKTPWPLFNDGAEERATISTPRLQDLLDGGLNNKPKRCVYRGKGAPCSVNLNAVTQFNDDSKIKHHACSPNHYCARLAESRFNNRIIRLGKSPKFVSTATDYILEALELGSFPITDTFDSFGLNAKMLGRPWHFNGTETPTVSAVSSTSSLNSLSGTGNYDTLVQGICVPGKTRGSGALSADELNQSAADPNNGDRVLNTGLVQEPGDSGSANLGYYNSCPIVDEKGDIPHLKQSTFSDPNAATVHAIRNNLSSSLLTHDDFSSIQEDLFVEDNQPLNDVLLQKNICLRAPGASCFTDFDCAPSKFIENKVLQLSSFSDLNLAEQKFWQEGLICGQKEFKFYRTLQASNPEYDLKKNRCCRETGRDLSIHSSYLNAGGAIELSIEGNVNWEQIAGVNLDLDDNQRYSRIHTVHDLIEQKSYLPLKVPAPDAQSFNSSDVVNANRAQWQTLDKLAQRTCCSSSWVRKFADGTHRWSASKHQEIQDKSMFQCLSWLPKLDSDENGFPFLCSNDAAADNYHASAGCRVRNFTQEQARGYLNYFGLYELLGIPQIIIDNSDPETAQCKVDYVDQVAATGNAIGTGIIIPNTIRYDGDATPEFDNEDKFSAGDMTNFIEAEFGGPKKIFSEDEFSCCTPSGEWVPEDYEDEKCCTGLAFNNRCCLEDFTNVSVYLNRYVSSEASFLPDAEFDLQSGYIKDPELVKEIIEARNLCCSGRFLTGVAIAYLFIPGTNDQDDTATTRRFLYGAPEDQDHAQGFIDLFESGLKWNNHVYCVPPGLETDIGGGGGAVAQ